MGYLTAVLALSTLTSSCHRQHLCSGLLNNLSAAFKRKGGNKFSMQMILKPRISKRRKDFLDLNIYSRCFCLVAFMYLVASHCWFLYVWFWQSVLYPDSILFDHWMGVERVERWWRRFRNKLEIKAFVSLLWCDPTLQADIWRLDGISLKYIKEIHRCVYFLLHWWDSYVVLITLFKSSLLYFSFF